jgi:hypothetical protein
MAIYCRDKFILIIKRVFFCESLHYFTLFVGTDELITRPRSTADCPRSSNRNETESFMEAAKAQNWAVEP